MCRNSLILLSLITCLQNRRINGINDLAHFSRNFGLTGEEQAKLKELSGSRKAAKRETERAKVMLGYADGTSVTELQRSLGFSRTMIYRCIDKALAGGIQMGLKDKYHRP